MRLWIFLLHFFSQVLFVLALREPSEWLSYVRFKRQIPCPYAKDPASSVSNALLSTIAAQHIAVSNITDAVTSWSAAIEDGKPRPLVLVLTGSTGTGKSETAHTIAKALLVSRVSLEGGGGGSSDTTTPEGLIELRGEDYTDTSNITNLQENIRDAIATSLYQCRGHSVLIFDEAQKAAKGALSVLSALLQGRHSKLRHPDLNTALDATRMVIIIISDIGVPEIEQFINEELSMQVQSLTSRDSLPISGGVPKYDVGMLHRRLSIRMRQRLTNEFSNDIGSSNGLDLGNLAEAIIPFMPFNYSGTQALLNKELENFANSRGFQLFADHLEWSPELIAYLSLPKFVRYSTEETSSGAGSNRCASDLRILSEQRRSRKVSLTRAPVLEIVDVLPDGSGALQQESSVGSGDLRNEKSDKIPSNTFSSSLICGEPCDMPRSCLVRHGGRAISWHEDGPVKRVAHLLRRELRKLPGEKASLHSQKGALASFISNPVAWLEDKSEDLWESIRSRKSNDDDESHDDNDNDDNNDDNDENIGESGGLITIRLDIDCGSETLLDGTCSLRGVAVKIERCIDQDNEDWNQNIDDRSRLQTKKEICSLIYRGAL
jgi:DNA replication protein DnaC